MEMQTSEGNCIGKECRKYFVVHVHDSHPSEFSDEEKANLVKRLPPSLPPIMQNINGNVNLIHCYQIASKMLNVWVGNGENYSDGITPPKALTDAEK